jgi:hypothetical protein
MSMTLKEVAKYLYVHFYNCKVNDIYILHSRNLSFGVFTSLGTFIGLRTKFDSTFLDHELHIDRGGTARPLEKIATVPDNIPLCTSLGTCDEVTGKMVEFDKPIVDGGKGWYFVSSGMSSQNIKPYHKDNDKLFNYLKDIGTVLSSCGKI